MKESEVLKYVKSSFAKEIQSRRKIFEA